MEDKNCYGVQPGRKAAIKGLILNPGYLTIRLYRAARNNRLRGKNLRADLFWRANVFITGCHFHYDSVIGERLLLPHPTGIVIGSGVRLGNDITLYQGVTVGQRSSADRMYPTIEDGVTIYANSTIVGGICIGAGATIGANSFVNRNVSPGDFVAGVPARSIKSTERA